MIEVKEVQKTIGGKLILNHVSFTINKGSRIGKTNLLKLMVGILQPDGGSVTFADHNVVTQPEIKEKIVYVPDYLKFISNFQVATVCES